MRTSAATTSRSSRRPAKGFSLAELTAVLAIISMAASAVVLNTASAQRHLEINELAAQVIEFDRRTRLEAAAKDRPLRLEVDLSAGELRRDDGRPDGAVREAYKLPANYRISRLLVRKEDLYWGQASLACSRRGMTPTYAIRLEHTPTHKAQWLVVAGLTGQATRAEDEGQARKILEAASDRADAR